MPTVGDLVMGIVFDAGSYYRLLACGLAARHSNTPQDVVNEVRAGTRGIEALLKFDIFGPIVTNRGNSRLDERYPKSNEIHGSEVQFIIGMYFALTAGCMTGVDSGTSFNTVITQALGRFSSAGGMQGMLSRIVRNVCLFIPGQRNYYQDDSVSAEDFYKVAVKLHELSEQFDRFVLPSVENEGASAVENEPAMPPLPLLEMPQAFQPVAVEEDDGAAENQVEMKASVVQLDLVGDYFII